MPRHATPSKTKSLGLLVLKDIEGFPLSLPTLSEVEGSTLSEVEGSTLSGVEGPNGPPFLSRVPLHATLSKPALSLPNGRSASNGLS